MGDLGLRGKTILKLLEMLVDLALLYGAEVWVGAGSWRHLRGYSLELQVFFGRIKAAPQGVPKF